MKMKKKKMMMIIITLIIIGPASLLLRLAPSSPHASVGAINNPKRKSARHIHALTTEEDDDGDDRGPAAGIN